MPPKPPTGVNSYVGRFAPSPTGSLHFGSLVAALGSCLEARQHGGRWLLRMEDVDQPRCSEAAAADILRALERLGFSWDGQIVVQSQRTAHYQQALELLKANNLAYACGCSRKEIGDSVIAIDGAARYPGTCRAGLPVGKFARAWRLKVADAETAFDDGVQGRVVQNLFRDVGDFVLSRADGYFAYQLAVVVDDAEQGITHVVRGADLLDSTPRQICLQHCLNLPMPNYMHLPVALNGRGEKLSKQTGAQPIDPQRPTQAIAAALDFLGQRPPPDLATASLADAWRWAREHWQSAMIPRCRGIRTEW
jgi:glutamyl-Q tRNA(Asp) synthetase